jgi:hypothetical protein
MPNSHIKEQGCIIEPSHFNNAKSLKDKPAVK